MNVLFVNLVQHRRKPWCNTIIYAVTFYILSNCKESSALLLSPVAVCVCYDKGCSLPGTLLICFLLELYWLTAVHGKSFFYIPAPSVVHALLLFPHINLWLPYQYLVHLVCY